MFTKYLVAASSVFMASTAIAQTMIKIGAIDFPPYTIEKGFEITTSKSIGNCKIEKGIYHGIDVDFLELVLRTAGIEYKTEYFPFARLKDLIKSNAVQVIPGMLYAEDGGKPRYKYVLYNVGGYTLLYKKSDTKIKIQSVKDLKSLQVGVVRDDSYGDSFDKAIQNGTLLIKEENKANSDEQNFEKLISGRIDLLAINNIVGPFLVKSKKWEAKVEPVSLKFQYGSDVKSNGIYFAFSQKTPDEFIEKVKESVKTLQKNKSFECIRLRYGVTSN